MTQVPYAGSIQEAVDKAGDANPRIVIEAPVAWPRAGCFLRYGYDERCWTTLPGYYVVTWNPWTRHTVVEMDILLGKPKVSAEVQP